MDLLLSITMNIWAAIEGATDAGAARPGGEEGLVRGIGRGSGQGGE